MEFDYFEEDYVNFEKDFTELYVGDTPLAFITDDMLKTRSVYTPFFILPGHMSKDRLRHVFYFVVEEDKYIYSHYE